MAHFIKIEFLDDLGEMKINLDKVTTVSINKGDDNRKCINIHYDNGYDAILVEGISIKDAEQTFKKFPC